METMGWEQRWAKMGVKAVIEPQAAADSRRTFSPPTLKKHGETVRDKQAGRQTLLTWTTRSAAFYSGECEGMMQIIK